MSMADDVEHGYPTQNFGRPTRAAAPGSRLGTTSPPGRFSKLKANQIRNTWAADLEKLGLMINSSRHIPSLL